MPQEFQSPSVAVAAAAALSAYTLLSGLLLRYPTLLHRRKRRHFAAAHISHRGGAAELAENTMEAFEAAVSQHRTHMLELDCQITRDGQVVVAHDNDLNRLCAKSGRIDQINYAELPPIRRDLAVTFEPGLIVTAGKDRRIPLLAEVLVAFPNVPLNIDIKEDRPDLLEAVRQLVVQHGRQDTVVWGNRSYRVVRQLRAMEPRVSTLFSMRSILFTVLLYATGLLPFVPISDDFFEPPMLSALLELEPFAAAYPNWFGRCLVRIFDILMMSPKLIRHLHERGVPTYVWVLNQEQHFLKAFQAGCEGVMTDRPELLRRFIDSNPDCLDAYRRACDWVREDDLERERLAGRGKMD
uniref:GP-PDE domain-containing protein n=2 Tax=Macrostomum lignano TaxID=282301 RepID=A0A1I8HS37_9PLAT